MTDPVTDWQNALQGKLPQHQAFPQDPEYNPVNNFIRWLASGALNIPPAVVGGTLGIPNLALGSVKSRFGVGEIPTPAEVAPAQPPTLINPDLKTLAPEAVSPTKTLFSVPSPELPKPPLTPPPPMAAVPGIPDFSAVRGFAEQSKPAPLDEASLNAAKNAAILGGMAKGAGSVSATEPGSFAKALAMWGAGGAGGQQTAATQRLEAGERQSTRMSEYNLNQAKLEVQLAQLKQQAEQNQATVNHQNAMRAYETTVTNQKTQHDYLREKYGIEKPSFTMGSDGRVLIQQRDPTTGEMKVQVHDTDPAVRKATDIGNMLKAAQVPGGEFIKYRVLTDQNLPPEVIDKEFRRMAVHEVVAAGGAATAFGAKRVGAELAAIDKQLSDEGYNKNSEGYAALRQQRLISRLLPLASADDAWIWDAVPFSPGANIMASELKRLGKSQAPKPGVR